MAELRGRYFCMGTGSYIRSGACGAPVVRLRENRPIRLTMTSAITAPITTEAALAKIRSGRWRANQQANNWVGYAIADVLGVDARDAGGKAKVKAALNIWLASGTLRVVTAKDEKNVFKQFVEVAPGGQ